MSDIKIVQGKRMFDAVRDRGIIIMAANTRMTMVTEGIFQAAKEAKSVVMVELAKSESNLEDGYTGLLPMDLSIHTQEAAKKTGFDGWALHADHLTVKRGDSAEIDAIKSLVKAQIDAHFTSFAIDASHLFNFEGGDLEEELSKNIEATTEIAHFIKDHYGSDDFGLEVEVGEIGRKNDKGMVLTRPEEAATFIKALNRNGVEPQVIAIANGSSHGNIYDDRGNLIKQISIDIPQTVAVAKALRDMGSPVRIAQHGITGTPRHLIRSAFPHGDIIKGNVGTFWQNLVFDTFKVYEPDLYDQILEWTVNTYRAKYPTKGKEEIFGKMGKMAIKEFFDDIYAVGDDTREAITAQSRAQALMFFKAFNSYNSGKLLDG
ncbi:MAG TPA: class II fructose-bisphosphate aldolase [Euryarchaeota archaeon]|nr:class II fructose-bisphosphate aldolase [Euryarchaeota archaeon]